MDDFDKMGLDNSGKKPTGETFGQWLQTKFSEYVNAQVGRRMGVPSMADWAKYLGIKNTNLSQYMNDNRRPAVQEADKLADKLGVEVYDRLDLPRRMPRNPGLLFVANHWSDVSEDVQHEIVERVKNKVAEKAARRDDRNVTA